MSLCFKITSEGTDLLRLISLFTIILSWKIWHCWKHQRNRGPGEETGRPVQRPGHQHVEVLLLLLRAGVRGG